MTDHTARRTRASIEAENRFRVAVALHGGTITGTYANVSTPVEVRCPEGHACTPRPWNVISGHGFCRACAGRDPVAAETEFRAILAEAGAELITGRWLGTDKPHDAICAAGHPCRPRPHDVRKGIGICRTCSGKDPAVAEAEFLKRLKAIGAVPLYDTYRGVLKPHKVRCSQGHICQVPPAALQRGRGPCLTCAGHDPAVAEAAFRARCAELGITLTGEYASAHTPVAGTCPEGHPCSPVPHHIRKGGGACPACSGSWDAVYVVSAARSVKFGITSGDARPRLAEHARDGYRTVVRLVAGLPGTVALDTENAIRKALRMAGHEPVKGREYFGISCLALILDVADSWLAA